MVKEVIREVDTTVLRKFGGFAPAVNLSFVKINGEDASRYLQAQTTNDINALCVRSGQPSCFIDRKARPVAAFHIYRLQDCYAIICDTTQVQALLAHLDKFRFADRVAFEDLTTTIRFIPIQGPRSRLLIKNVLDEVPPVDLFDHEVCSVPIASREVTIFKQSLTGEEGYLLKVQADEHQEVQDAIAMAAKALDMIELDDALLETARIESGLVKLGVDFNEENLLAETILDESSVSYTKGCFQGQEVLARIKTHGAPTRALVGLTITPRAKEQLAEEPRLSGGEERAGVDLIRSTQSNLIRSAPAPGVLSPGVLSRFEPPLIPIDTPLILLEPAKSDKATSARRDKATSAQRDEATPTRRDDEATPARRAESQTDSNETIGWLKSNCYSRFLNRFIAIALLKRDFRTPDKTWTVSVPDPSIPPLDISVSLLPFYRSQSPEDAAKKLYEEALQIFAKEDESINVEQSQSIRLLREALVLNPLFEDAYESLGVILSKRNRLDEAIELMEFLAKLNPDSVMAHTNLSVFYVEKGWKEKAEDEKAISMSIRMRMAAKKATKEKEEETKRKATEEETRQRLFMFQQVLEIDPDDQLANYGIGDCLVELLQFQEALPHLNKALELKPTHSVGYLVLGKAYEGLERFVEARQTYEKGIDMAAKRGDMEPLKKMQERLAACEG